MNEESTYICDYCGEEIVVPIDHSAGSSQKYVEDCPVCCSPSVIHVEIDEDGDVRVWGKRVGIRVAFDPVLTLSPFWSHRGLTLNQNIGVIKFNPVTDKLNIGFYAD